MHDRDLPFAETAQQVLARAGVEANRLRHEYVGTEHRELPYTSRTPRVFALAKDCAKALGEREVGAEHLHVVAHAWEVERRAAAGNAQ